MNPISLLYVETVTRDSDLVYETVESWWGSAASVEFMNSTDLKALQNLMRVSHYMGPCVRSFDEFYE